MQQVRILAVACRAKAAGNPTAPKVKPRQSKKCMQGTTEHVWDLLLSRHCRLKESSIRPTGTSSQGRQ